MLHTARINEVAVDVVPEHAFHIIDIGLNAEAGRWILSCFGRRNDLIRLDEPNTCRALDVYEEP